MIDRDESLVEDLRRQGFVAVHGDAEQDETLLAARIDRASALVSAAPEDATNLVVVLSARALCPSLRIVARVEDQRWCTRLLKAGADVIRNPYDEFGSGLAVSAVGDHFTAHLAFASGQDVPRAVQVLANAELF